MPHKEWIRDAIRKIDADFNRSADTHLIALDLPGFPGIRFYLKDESSHPTGSLKHRLARSLFLYALCNGWLNEKSTVVEASSGSTAISEAYFAQLLGLPFVAVIPASTSRMKIEEIEFYGGHCHLVANPAEIYAESHRIAQASGGHFMDQFTYAERATDWRANNNIAESIFKQMADEAYPVPTWLVSSGGTGGTIATLGRYVAYRRHKTRVMCADPEHSVFFDYFKSVLAGHPDSGLTLDVGSRIEGIGRPRVERSFIPTCIDAMVKVPDPLSFAAMRYLAARLGKRVGGSTGTNFVGVLFLAGRMKAQGESGAIVSLLCDSGERYRTTYYHEAWYEAQGIRISEADALIARAVRGEPIFAAPEAGVLVAQR
ncbi:MAG: PLP-dependent cysteine synthase family protein [Paraburkholderia sp.]|uniref:PLP-dependent cysteine synthase family protein n=1 Tax=Paraburkholderia sp. TaxID=1926495 RepID=UPI0012282149|nr:PLP-dependent cysteine synthase family protein [Paraburkholderia sp.]TAM07953.1 MAG: PLP-dependent cysteine synthase family protein [Paraburkholderia sp.]TAM31819.1 MAG: PLP-dependent cysteine synthase family protein [Paraburkholderia sp.]